MTRPFQRAVNRRGFLADSLAAGAVLASPGLTHAAGQDRAAAQREHARKLHRESIVIVLHDLNPIVPDIQHMVSGGVTAKVYHVGVDVDLVTDFKKSIYDRKDWSRRALGTLWG